MFRWIDEKLLEMAQWICDNFATLTGLTKFKLEKWAVILSSMFFAGSIASDLTFAGCFVVLLDVSFAILIVRMIEARETEFLESSDTIRYHFGQDSTSRIVMYLWNGLLVAVIMFLLQPRLAYQFLSYALICNVAWVYFAACVPKPPCKSKVLEWLKKGLQWLKDQKPEAEPVPEPT